MPPEDHGEALVARWLALVEEDLLLARKGLTPPYAIGGAVYHCQQATEKALKTFLVASGHDYPRTHDLLRLIERCLPLEQDFDHLRPHVEFLNPFASQTRYPEYGEFPTLDEANAALEHAIEVATFVRSRLPGDVRS